MRVFQNSDVFTPYDEGNVISGKIFKLLAGQSNAVFLNDKLKKEFDNIQRIYKEPITLSILKEIREGNLVLVRIPMENNIPSCLPFIKYKKNGAVKVVINLTNYLSEKKDADTGEITYSIDIKQLYVLCLTSYIHYKLLDDNVTLSPTVVQISATLWARMFNKILIKTIGLSTNKERYEAFMYFAMRFFMIYYLECPDIVVDSISNAYLKKGKSYLINYMESKISELELKPYESFTQFCTVLFNNEVSNIKGIKVNNVSDALNCHFYIKKFISMYNFEAVFSLVSYPYFLFTIISAFNRTKICNDRSMEDIVFNDNVEMPKLLSELYKEMK